LGFIIGTSFPVVAVLSGSMEHNNFFNDWWDENHDWYSERGFTEEEFEEYCFHNGFNKGDIMVIFGVKPEKVKIGDVIVYNDYKNKYPIIHRVVNITENRKDYKYQTKGDNNFMRPDQFYVEEKQLLGKAFFRVPLLGWVKIWAVDIFNFVTGGFLR